jgi:YidC/Oxa1 family membrane protein insertase
MYIANVLQPLIDACDAVLRFWHDLLGNFEGSWGVAIILLTFTVRLVILPLTFKGVKSMQRLQTLQPEIKQIQERYKDDRQRMNQEVMAFYQREKVNPLGSCLPLLLQIPFFIALFSLLRSSSFQQDIAENPSFLFIDDLAHKVTEPAVLVVLIVLYVGTQLAATSVTAFSADPMQRRIMFALPFVFVVFVINFPAGLIVYWITTNVWTIGQQLMVKKLYPKPPPRVPSDEKEAAKPARGKPPSPRPAGAAALADGSSKSGVAAQPDAAAKAGGAKAGGAKAGGAKAGGAKAGAAKAGAAKGGGGNGGPTKPPPPSPRKKKKRSGRRR